MSPLVKEHLERAAAHKGQARRLNRKIDRELRAGEVVEAELYQVADRHSAAALKHRETADWLKQSTEGIV